MNDNEFDNDEPEGEIPEEVRKELESMAERIGGELISAHKMGPFGMTRMMVEKHKHGKVIKTFPAKPEWKKMVQEEKKKIMEANIMIDQLNQRKNEIDSRRKLFWGLIETELGLFGKHLQYNDNTDEIELMEEIKKEK